MAKTQWSQAQTKQNTEWVNKKESPKPGDPIDLTLSEWPRGLKEARRFCPPIFALKFTIPFQVMTVEGDLQIGSSGDYLVVGSREDRQVRYIVPKKEFEESYEWVQ